MFRTYVCVAILAVMCLGVIGQDEDYPDEWEPRQMPSPQRNPEQCRIGSRPGYLCDPNGVLSERSVELLDWLLRGFYDNDTVCPCSTYWCEATRKGSQLSVAIVRKLKLADTFEDTDVAAMQAASNFAFKLQDKYWNFGQCDNTIVILFSQDDGVLFISYGQTIGLTMNNQMVDYIQRQYGHNFKQGGDLFTGLVEIILAMRQVLNGYNRYDPNRPHFEQLVGGASHLTSGVVATTSLALLSTVWFSQ